MRYLLVGNYGTGNLGDSALKDYFLSTFPEVQWAVLSARPSVGELPRFPLGLRSLIQTPWWKTVRALKESDGIVFGGGSLFTDSESIVACLLWGWHALLARVFGKHILLAFQGIGPFRTHLGIFITKKVCSWADFISVRDESSAALVALWKLNTISIQSFDPVFSLIQRQKHDGSTKKLLSIIPRATGTKAFQKRCRDLASAYESVQILSLEPCSAREQRVCRHLQKHFGASVPVIDIQSLTQLAEKIEGSAYVLSQRYHGALAAIALGIPVEIIPQRPGDKLSALRVMATEDHERSGTACYLESLVRKGEEALRLAFRNCALSEY